MLKENDEIFCLFKEYKQKISQDAEKNNERVYGIDQMASRLAVAHVIHKVFQDGIAIDMTVLETKNIPPTVRKVNKTWQEKLGDDIEGKEELEIMRNNFAVTSTSTTANAEVDWKING